MLTFRFVQRRKRSIEECVKDVIYNRRHDARARHIGVIFRVLSLPFYGAVCLREKAYRSRFLRGQHLGCITIVVGNLTVGGTGKTPIVEKLARLLRDKGRRVAILSRGYKSKKEPFWKKWWHWLLHSEPCPPKVVSDGQRCLLPPSLSGDEPLLLARNLPGVCVVVDKDRIKAGQYAIKNLNCDTLILDDGFQYFQLAGTFYILLVDATNPFGNGLVLPRGILREPLSHMRRAQFIFITKSDQVSANRVQALRRFIQRYNPMVPIVSCIHSPKYLKAVSSGERLELSDLKDKNVAILSGIASPQLFEQFIINCDANVVYKDHFLDHHYYTKEELVEFCMQAKHHGATWVVTTEKDAARLTSVEKLGLPFYFLRMEIEWGNHENPLEHILNQLSPQLQ